MGKFTTIIPNPENRVNPDIIQDIHDQLLQKRHVLIIYDSSKISRQTAAGLLKKILLNDLPGIRVIEKKDFESQKAQNLDMGEYYQISAEGVLGYLANIPDASS